MFQHATSSALVAGRMALGSQLALEGGTGPFFSEGAETADRRMISSPAMPTPAFTPEVEMYWKR